MTTTRERLQAIANEASARGFQVIFGWSNSGSRPVSSITISGYDDYDYGTLDELLADKPSEPEKVTLEIDGLIFDKVNEDLWVHLNSEGERVFELSRQDYEGDDGTGDPALEDDWGVWSNVDDDWAHEPKETGFPTKQQAIDAFKRWHQANN